MKSKIRTFLEPVAAKVYEIPDFSIGKKVEIVCQDVNFKKSNQVRFKGEIIFINDRYLTVKNENYKESFLLNQFKSGEIKLISMT
jgi:ribosomal protein L19